MKLAVLAMSAMNAMWAFAGTMVEKHDMNGDDTMTDAEHLAWQEAAGKCHDALNEQKNAGDNPPVKITLNTFDEYGSAVGETVVSMTMQEISDCLSHAAQLAVIHNSRRRSSGDTEQVEAELSEAMDVSGILEAVVVKAA